MPLDCSEGLYDKVLLSLSCPTLEGKAQALKLAQGTGGLLLNQLSKRIKHIHHTVEVQVKLLTLQHLLEAPLLVSALLVEGYSGFD